MQSKPMAVNKIEIKTTPFAVNNLTSLTVKKDEIIVQNETTKVRIPWKSAPIPKDWEIAGQDEATKESGKPRDINIR